ncbi:MAG: methionine--tRNA ligase [Reyranellaceae bacterium]
MARFLITSALPYVNGVKHLGNLAGSLLPADIHARFRRQTGHEVLFLSGTDEHGTTSELAADAAGLPVDDWCARQHVRHAEIYRRFDLSFDHFSRTSGRANHRLTQALYHRLDRAGLIREGTVRQPWSPSDRRFLPDRYVVGTCPACGHGAARGDQCEACARLLDPEDLVAPRSALSGAGDIEFRESRHLFLRLSALQERLRDWIGSRRDWPPLVHSIARGWLAQGLEDRCITRDLSRGVPVPRRGFEDKIFYVWFDAPIGYIAAAVEWSRQAPGRDWRRWWHRDEDVRLLQFLAKDNVPFHTIVFPATLLGSGLPLRLPDVVKGFNWLTHEGGKFSTSAGRGLFTDRALDLLPADYWRWWLAANSPESADSDFTVERFVTGVNGDLADCFGNLVNRTLSLVGSRYAGLIPEGGADGPVEQDLVVTLEHRLLALRAAHEALHYRRAADEVRGLWRLANGYLARTAPWTTWRSDPEAAALAVRTAVNLVRVAALAAWPFIPAAAERVLRCLGEPAGQPPWPEDADRALDALPPGRRVTVPPPLFPRIDGACLSAAGHPPG